MQIAHQICEQRIHILLLSKIMQGPTVLDLKNMDSHSLLAQGPRVLRWSAGMAVLPAFCYGRNIVIQLDGGRRRYFRIATNCCCLLGFPLFTNLHLLNHLHYVCS